MADILAFDPGRVTGFCRMTVDDKGLDFLIMNSFEIDWDERLATIYHIFTKAQEDDYIVVEAFRLFPHKAMQQVGSDFPSSQVIGIIEAMCYINQVQPKQVVYQVPGDISRVQVLDKDLEYVAGSPHKIDAYRHARLFFLRHFLSNPFQEAHNE